MADFDFSRHINQQRIEQIGGSAVTYGQLGVATGDCTRCRGKYLHCFSCRRCMVTPSESGLCQRCDVDF